MKTLVITGAEGQLGQCFQYILAKNFQFKTHFISKSECDITQFGELKKCLNRLKPDIVINCAAYTKVDKAEDFPQDALEVNMYGVKNLVETAKNLNFWIVHFSTDYVFDGNQKTAYQENDQTNPLNIYAQTKLKGEKELFRASSPHCCIRSSWLFSPFGENFVKTIREKILNNETLRVVEDQWSRPTYGIDLAKVVVDLIQTNSLMRSSLYHFANKGVTSWLFFAQRIAAEMGIDSTIQPIASANLSNKAARPKYSELATERIEKIANFQSQSWEKALKECLILFDEIL